MTIDAAENRIIVVDGERLLAVDLASGAPTIFSDVTTPNNHVPFLSPVAVEIDPVNRRFLVVDKRTRSLLVVDAVNGQRVLVSR